MRFLADESCDFAVVRALRSEGHDVVAVAEISPRSTDTEVIAMARETSRVVLTEDKDFGQLVYASGSPSNGVILLRFPGRARAEISRTILKVIQEKGDRLGGRFVVVQPGRVRIGSPPTKRG